VNVKDLVSLFFYSFLRLLFTSISRLLGIIEDMSYSISM